MALFSFKAIGFLFSSITLNESRCTDSHNRKALRGAILAVRTTDELSWDYISSTVIQYAHIGQMGSQSLVHPQLGRELDWEIKR